MAQRMASLSQELFSWLQTSPDEDLFDFPLLQDVLDAHAAADATPGLPQLTHTNSGSGSHDSLLHTVPVQSSSDVSPQLWDGLPQQLGTSSGTLASNPPYPGTKYEASALAPLPPVHQASSGSEGAAFAKLNAGVVPAAPLPPAPTAARQHAPLAGRSSFTRISSGSALGSGDGDEDEDTLPKGGKKKRTRNEQQMAQNRVAQQKYRERKKAEHESLSKALDELSAQLAAMKALEAHAAMLAATNAALSTTVSEQADRIAALSTTVEQQAAELEAARAAAAQSGALVTQQQQMILDMHQRLKLQEEVIDALKGRLRNKVEEALTGVDQKTVCNRLIQAVRSALAGAKNVEGLQEVLETLPEEVITDVCKSILCECKTMWPELAQRLNALKMGPCPQGTTCAAAVRAAGGQ